MSWAGRAARETSSLGTSRRTLGQNEWLHRDCGAFAAGATKSWCQLLEPLTRVLDGSVRHNVNVMTSPGPVPGLVSGHQAIRFVRVRLCLPVLPVSFVPSASPPS